MGREIKDLEEYVHFLETVLDHLSDAVLRRFDIG